MQRIKIGFFGTPALAASVLTELLQDEYFEVMFVVTNPDKPFGRNQTLTASPVKNIALKNHLNIFQPEKIRGNDQFLNDIGSFSCDYFIVVAYGKILSAALLSIPKKMCINIHGSLLPKYRGASPIQSALLSGESETGVTIMKMSEGMDEGDIILIEKISINSGETSESLFQKFQTVSGKCVIQAVKNLEKGKISLTPQNHQEATYCQKIKKEDGLINWNKDANKLYQEWQAYTPWPGVYTNFRGKRLLLEKITLSSIPHNELPGTVFRNKYHEIHIAANGGSISPEILKLEGKKSQNIRDFLNGNPDFISSVL